MPRLLQEQEFIYTIENFKTMNRKVKDDLLPPDTAYNCQNLRYDTVKGMIYKRPSRRKYNSTTLGTDPITSQVRYYKNSDATQKYVIATSTFLKAGNDSAGTFSNIKTGLTINKRFSFITFKDRLYCFSGYGNNQVYDGTNIEDMGVPVPSAPTLALGGGGLTGAYYYKVTYMIDSYQEGSASSASSVINPSTQGVTVTIPTSSNTRVTHRKIYRTKAGGSIYYLLTTIANNTTTTYNDNTPDNSLSVTQAPTDYGAPASYRYAILHKSRVFLARNSTNKSRIIFSDIRSGVAYPDVFPVDNYFDIAKDDGDEITGISEDQLGNFIIWKTNSIRILYTSGESPKGWSISNPITRFGNVAPYFLCKIPIGVIYMTRFGEDKNRLMLWTGGGVKHICEEIDPILDNIDSAVLDNTIGHFHNGKIYISFTDTAEFPDPSVDSHTLLLAHFDDLSDSGGGSNCPHTITAAGDAQISTSNPSLGSGSLLLDGNGDYVYAADSADWNFGTNLFTIDFRVWFDSDPTVGWQGLIGQFADGENYWALEVTSGKVIFYAVDTSEGINVQFSTTSAVFTEIDTWYHVALVRYGVGENEVKIFINGISQSLSFDTPLGANESMPDINANLTIGASDSTPFYLNGKIDEFRISDIARWIDNFTVPTLPYGYSYNNKVLIIDAETLQMINIDDKAIDSFSSWNSGTDLGELYSGSSNIDGFCYEEETDEDASETTIEIEYQWGKLNFGQPRFRKRLKQVKIEFERDEASGTLSYFYSLDGATETQVDIAFSTYASQGYFIYDFPYNAYCFHIQPRLYSNSDIESLGIKRLTYVFSLEPYLPII